MPPLYLSSSGHHVLGHKSSVVQGRSRHPRCERTLIHFDPAKQQKRLHAQPRRRRCHANANSARASAAGAPVVDTATTQAPPSLQHRVWDAVSSRTQSIQRTLHPSPAHPSPSPSFIPNLWTVFSLGAACMLMLQFAVQWVGNLPRVRRFLTKFFWWILPEGHSNGAGDPSAPPGSENTAMVLYTDVSESVEWVNMCWRKAWRVYQRGLERWLADLLQPVFDNLVADGAVPRFVQRLRILEFTLDHEAPYFDNMRRRTSRKDSDLNGVVDVRYTGGAKLLLLIEVGQGRWRFKVPVLVSDLDLECKMWIKVRLAPMCPYLGTISLAFVGPPTIKVQLNPYNTVRLMRIPVLQAFLRKLFTVDLPGLMVLPRRLEINIPPAVTAVAEAAVGRDAVMRAVASAVLQADALEHALHAALPLGPQSPAGGIMLPDSFSGELQVTLREARNLPVGGLPWQSNPYCRMLLGNQVVSSRRDDDTSHAGRHRAPVWNQEFHFLVEDASTQTLDVTVRDSHLTGRSEVGYVRFPLSAIPPDGCIDVWLPVQPVVPGHKQEGELLLQLTYRPFEDDEYDSGYREAENFTATLVRQSSSITDVKSAADASSRAAVAASAAAAAVAVTKAAAARAAARALRLAQKKKDKPSTSSSSTSSTNTTPTSSNEPASPAITSSTPGANGYPREGPASKGGPATGRVGTGGPPLDVNGKTRGVGVGGVGVGGVGVGGMVEEDVGPGGQWSAESMKTLLDRVQALESLDEEEEAMTQRISDAYLDKQSQVLFPPASVRITDKADEDLPIGYTAPVGEPSMVNGMVNRGGDGVDDDVASHPIQQADWDTLSEEDLSALSSDDDDDYGNTPLVPTPSPDAHTTPTPAAAAGAVKVPVQDAGVGGVGAAAAAAVAGIVGGVLGEGEKEGGVSVVHGGGDDARAGGVVHADGAAASSPTATTGAPPVVEVEVLPALTDVDRPMFRDNFADTPPTTSSGSSGSSEHATTSSGMQGDASTSKPVAESGDDERSFLFGWMTWWGRDSTATTTKQGAAAGSRGGASRHTTKGAHGAEKSVGEGGVGGDQGGESSSFGAKDKVGGEEEQQAWWKRWGWWGDGGNQQQQQHKDGATSKQQAPSTDPSQPLSRVDLPPDLDIEALAEEVQNSWRLKEVHVENLLQRALAKRERPWLVLLSVLSAASVVMLIVVFYRLEHL